MRKNSLDITDLIFPLIYLIFGLVIGSEYNLWRMRRIINKYKEEFKIEDIIILVKDVIPEIKEIAKAFKED